MLESGYEVERKFQMQVEWFLLEDQEWQRWDMRHGLKWGGWIESVCKNICTQGPFPGLCSQADVSLAPWKSRGLEMAVD